jgi:hypothetical protein
MYVIERSCHRLSRRVTCSRVSDCPYDLVGLIGDSVLLVQCGYLVLSVF